MSEKMTAKQAIEILRERMSGCTKGCQDSVELLISIAERAGDVTTLWKIGEMTSDKAEEVSRWLLNGEGKDGGSS